MSSQNFKNHTRIHPMYHYLLPVILLALLIGWVILVIRDGLTLSSILTLLIFIFLAVTFILVRTYPLKAQDRAIRAEENLRHYVLTGKLLDSRLTIAQIVALRFAGDAEFPELCRNAASQNWSANDIKKQIKDWKADDYRI